MADIRGICLPESPGGESEDLHLVATAALVNFFEMVESGSLLQGFVAPRLVPFPERTSIY